MLDHIGVQLLSELREYHWYTASDGRIVSPSVFFAHEDNVLSISTRFEGRQSGSLEIYLCCRTARVLQGVKINIHPKTLFMEL